MRLAKRYPAELPDPSSVAPGTVIAGSGWGLFGEGQGWRQHVGRFTGPTWRSVVLETPAVRAVRRRVSALLHLLAFGYVAGVGGWSAARVGQQVTVLDIRLVSGIVLAVFVMFLVIGWSRIAVDDPRESAQAASTGLTGSAR